MMMRKQRDVQIFINPANPGSHGVPEEAAPRDYGKWEISYHFISTFKGPGKARGGVRLKKQAGLS